MPMLINTQVLPYLKNKTQTNRKREHIIRLGGWESLDMVVRYTRSVKFEESLKLYQAIR